MYTAHIRKEIAALDPYTPGLSIDEIREKYHLSNIIKMASNENPLGTSPLAQKAIEDSASLAFRYPRSGNPRLLERLASLYHIEPNRLIIGNGSDEVIDLLIRMLVEAEEENIVSFSPCFSLYTIQAKIAGAAIRQCPLKSDFSFNFDGLFTCVDEKTRLVFLTTPDNPSGYCPSREEVLGFAQKLSRFSRCLLVIDEAYMEFHPNETEASLLYTTLPDNVAIIRTFSKCYGLAGLRIGYGIVPVPIADAFWRTRLPFSVNILAEEAALAALDDQLFSKISIQTVSQGRNFLQSELQKLGCTVYKSFANFLLFSLPEPYRAKEYFEYLLEHGIIIRLLGSYNLPSHLRVSIGNPEENRLFLNNTQAFLQRGV